MNTSKATRKLVIAALFAAIICIVTLFVAVPSPVMMGYINLGDTFVLLVGWLIPAAYGAAAAGLGSALADVFAGFAMYAPATFVIKGVMALVASVIFRFTKGKLGEIFAQIISGIVAEVIMVAGYFVYEGFIYGFASAATSIPANAVQGGCSLIVACLLAGGFSKIRSHII